MPIEQIDAMIHTIRGVRVMLDRDLARIYGVPTFRFNEAIKRNRHRFPRDFVFQLTREEFDSLISQNAMSKRENSSQIAMSKTGRGVGVRFHTRSQNTVHCRQQMFFAARVPSR
jgi:ORF6N domain